MGMEVQRLLKPDEAAFMLGVNTKDLPSIVGQWVRMGPKTTRYQVSDILKLWPRYRAGEDFDSYLHWVLEDRKPVQIENPVTMKGRFKLPYFPINGRVYFIRGDDYIKIGYTKKPLQRLENLKCGAPFKLKLLASMPGSVKLEKYLHERFSDLHHHGEWFRADEKLLRFINEATSWKH